MKKYQKTALGIIVILLVVAAAIIVYKKHRSNSSQDVLYIKDANNTTQYISEGEAITELNADNIQATYYVSNTDERIYLKNQHQWFILQGDSTKFQQAINSPSCGFECRPSTLIP